MNLHNLVAIGVLALAGMCSLQAQVVPMNGAFEDPDNGGVFSLDGWTWNCEEPEQGPNYMSFAGVQRLTAVTGSSPDPCSGVTWMHHTLPDVANAIYTITGWAYVDDPNMSASIGFGTGDGQGGNSHQGDFTNSSTWDFLTYSAPWAVLFQGMAPKASLVTSDGLSGFGYAHYDQLEVTISDPTTSVVEQEEIRVSLAPSGERLAVWVQSGMPLLIRVCDAMGRTELAQRYTNAGPSQPMLIDVSVLSHGIHIVQVDGGSVHGARRFLKL